ncbi:MAG: hypothetical protein PHH14_05875 [Candidatus Margulisbacteria bacterium]|nr:hypothetical protein [Candidatus Margulisiibacteriota bacterium]
MKLLERILPGFLKTNLPVYNISVIIICVLLFIVLLFVGATLSIFISFGIDTYLKSRGYHLEIALFAVILLLIVAAAVLDFIFCVSLLLANLKLQ